MRFFGVSPDKDYKDDFKDHNESKEEKPKDGEKSGGAGFKKFEKSYKKPDFLQDDYDHLKKEKGHATIESTGFDIGDDEFLPDYFVLDAPSYKRNTVAINLPWLINGAPELPIHTRFLGEQIFSRMKVHKN